jgi:uncharacterized membrane protein
VIDHEHSDVFIDFFCMVILLMHVPCKLNDILSVVLTIDFCLYKISIFILYHINQEHDIVIFVKKMQLPSSCINTSMVCCSVYLIVLIIYTTSESYEQT